MKQIDQWGASLTSKDSLTDIATRRACEQLREGISRLRVTRRPLIPSKLACVQTSLILSKVAYRMKQRRTEYPLTAGGWIPYPIMLRGWNQPIIWTFLQKTGFWDIICISYDAQKAYCAKRSSLRCYTMVPTLSPNVYRLWNWKFFDIELVRG